LVLGLKSRTAFAVLIAGIAIREALAPFTGHPYDFELWVRLGYYVSHGGNPYVAYPPVPGLSFPASESPRWPGYPPVWPLILAGIYKLFSITGINSQFFYYFLIKQPMILADLADAFVISKLVSSNSSSDTKGFRAFCFWLLCPYTIIISAVWGMFDQLILLLVLASIYFFSRTFKSSLLESLGIALKLLPVIFLPLFAGVQRTLKKTALYLIATLAFVLGFAYLPYLYFQSWTISSLNSVEFSDVGRVANSVSYWEIVVIYSQYHPFSSDVYHALYYLGYAWILAVLVASYFCIRLVRGHGDSAKMLILSCLVVTLVFLLTKAAVSEQFIIYFLGFGIFDYFVRANRRRKLLFFAVWLTALFYLVLNNELLSIFLSPLSPSYLNFSYSTAPGWDYLIVSASVLFSAFCILYLVSLVRDIRVLSARPTCPAVPISGAKLSNSSIEGASPG
jgi:Gpi18-like mannosyltransferase